MPQTLRRRLVQAVEAGSSAREAALRATIGQFLDRFSPDECRNHLANSGYECT